MRFTGHVPGTREYRRLIAGLFFAGVATFAQLYAPQAVLPQLSHALDITPATAAVTVSAGTLGIAVAVIPWSIVADRIGRVPAMTVGVVIATAVGLIAPLSGDVSMLLALRLVEGIALGAVPAVALAYLSEEVHARHVATAAGSYIAGTTVGGLAGRIVSGLVGESLDWRSGVWAAVGMCAASAVLFVWLTPRAQGFIAGRGRADRGPAAGERLRAALTSAPLWALYVQGFLLMGAFVAVYNYLGFHLSAPPFALPAWLVTLLFLAYLAGTASSPWAGLLASRNGRLPVLLCSIGVMAIGTALMTLPATAGVLVGLVLFTAGFFGAHAVASGWTPVAAGADARAQASSLYYFAYYAGSSLFGWGLGVLFGGAGWEALIIAVLAMCALAAAAAALALRPGALTSGS